ncbi:MAG: 50S ribosomal protein L21 [Actinomycetota bacterium]
MNRPMYAVIKTGGKQYKVTQGDVLEVELLRPKDDAGTVEIVPLLVVNEDGTTVHGAGNLAPFKVALKVLGETKGEKLTVFKYRNKSGYASKTGHRQKYSTVEVVSIGSQGEPDSKSDEAAADPTPEPASLDA